MTIHYHDLEIEIDCCCCGEQEIRILESSFDRPRARFALTADRRAALDAKVQELEELLLAGDQESRRRELAEAVGMELYEILLPEPIRRTFERSHAALRSGEGLRLRLAFGRPSKSALAIPPGLDASPGSEVPTAGTYDYQLGSLPWELLCKPETRRFIGNRSETPVVRYLDLGERIEPLSVAPPLKVLSVIASPDPAKSERYRYSKIDPEPHRRILEQAIAAGKHLQYRPLEKATLPALHKKLFGAERAGTPFHAIHFVGHGGFNAEGEGALFFESEEDGGEHLVTGAELAAQLTGDVRFIVLASCKTGKIPPLRRNGQHPFAGVASALVAAGKPAVVAMQFSVSEPAVAAFARAFYDAIDADQPIDNAVTEGRLAIAAHGEEGDLEWATPVLFLRSPDGRILNLCPGVPAKTVAIFNVLDLGKERMEHVDFQVDLRRYFEDRFIRDLKDWNGAIMDAIRHTLREQVPPESPCHLELAAPLSVAFACGFLLPAKERRAITVGQRDEKWSFAGEPPPYAPLWLDAAAARELIPDDFPFAEDSDDVAVVVEGARPAIGAVADYLKRQDLDPPPPRVGDLVYARFSEASQYSILSGAHARRLAEILMERIEALARQRGYPTVHIFLAGANGLALAIGRLSHVLPQIQLYEFDFGKRRHKTYEPSITLEPPRMGETP